MNKVKKNAKEWPKKYKAKFFEPGLCSYEDSNDGMILIKKETIDKMLPSMNGKPVVLDHQDVTPENLLDHSVGYVSDAWYNEADGWYYANFIVHDDEAKEKIEKENYSVSCAYEQKKEGKGGSYHAMDYDYEIEAAEFTHLAIVDAPRYEDAKIFLNSKKGKKAKFLRKNKKEIENAGIFSVEIDGSLVSFEALANSYKKNKLT